MTNRRPLVVLAGGASEMPTGDAVPVANGGTGATAAAGALANLGLNNAGAVSFRNRIVNGAFSVNQRGALASSTAYAAGVYVMDRWKAGANGCTLSFAAAASGDVTVTITAGTLLQVIEGGLYLPEGGAYVLSWAGSAPGRAYQGSASGAYAASPVAVAGLTAGANATVEFGIGTLRLAQFEPGAVATVFERRDDEMRRCLRYFATSPYLVGLWSEPNATLFIVAWTFAQMMRVAPSLSLAPGNQVLDRFGFGASTISSVGENTQVTSSGSKVVLVTDQQKSLVLAIVPVGTLYASAEL